MLLFHRKFSTIIKSLSDQRELTLMKEVPMGRTIKREKEDDATRIKKPYLTPLLVCYGTLKELTRGGSGTNMEGAAMISRKRYP